jgi:hypothetical protein
VLVTGCGKPGDIAENYTNCWVTITSLNGGTPLESDVLSNGYAENDVITVALRSVFRAPDGDSTAPNGPSIWDTITFHSYLVTHRRSDGGSNPSSFTGGLTVSIDPNSEAQTDLVVVRAFDKHRSPLIELRDDGELFTTCILTLYGTDGNGNDIAVSDSIMISYANYPDS